MTVALEETRFHQIADETIETLSDVIDDALGDDLDVDLQSGILTMVRTVRSGYLHQSAAPVTMILMKITKPGPRPAVRPRSMISLRLILLSKPETSLILADRYMSISAAWFPLQME
jgi:hypothetical protein